ncbi:MAG UNVERIFIED_CONTAM: ABC transporter permease [Anaerolineae bacterium]|jgi:ribose transport system permease protein
MFGQAMATQVKNRQQFINPRIIEFLTRTWSYLFLIGIVIFFSLTGTGFFTVRNFSSILTTSTLIMLMAVGQTYVVITAGIDLSIGWTVGLSSVTTARVMRDLVESGSDIAFAMVAGVFAGLLVALIPGIINGLLVAKIKVPPFIATLGMFGIVRGAAFLLTDGQQVVGGLSPELREALRSIGNGSLLYYIPGSGLEWFALPEGLEPSQLRTASQLLPYPVIITALVVAIFAFILARTKFGRHTYVIGGSEEAARRSGISVDRHLIIIYVLCAFASGIAGVLHLFRFTAGAPQAGEAALLSSVAAVVIGGTDLFGGEGDIMGAVVGALIIAVLQTGLVILNIDPIWQFIVVGVVIIIAVLVNQAKETLERLQANA